MSGKRSKVKTIDLTRDEIDLTRNYIQEIPKDLMKEILKHVHYRDIVRLGLTDKSMNEMTRLEFSNLLSEANPLLERFVSRMRAPFMTSIEYSYHAGIGKDEWWKERYYGPIDSHPSSQPPYQFANTYPVNRENFTYDNIERWNNLKPGAGLVTRLKQPIDRGPQAQARARIASQKRPQDALEFMMGT